MLFLTFERPSPNRYSDTMIRQEPEFNTSESPYSPSIRVPGGSLMVTAIGRHDSPSSSTRNARSEVPARSFFHEAPPVLAPASAAESGLRPAIWITPSGRRAASVCIAITTSLSDVRSVIAGPLIAGPSAATTEKAGTSSESEKRRTRRRRARIDRGRKRLVREARAHWRGGRVRIEQPSQMIGRRPDANQVAVNDVAQDFNQLRRERARVMMIA